MLVGVTVLAIAYRLLNPMGVTFVMPTFLTILSPHDFSHVLFQATIAILLLVGFESATALAAEAKHPSHVSRGVMLSLAIQGLFAYLFEYFGFQAWMNNGYTRVLDGKTYVGFAAAAQSSAPMGDMVRDLGNTLLAGHGFELMAISAAAVAAAILGTTLACLNTGARITFAMGQDTEMPRHLGRLHPRNSIPHYGVWALTGVSAIIGSFGVLSLRNLTAITFLSNIGTFLLYGLTNVVALVALARDRHRSAFVRVGVPVLGAAANAAMMVAVVWLGIMGGGDTQWAASVALVAAGAWTAAGVVYLLANSMSLTLKRPILLRAEGRRPVPSPPGYAPSEWRPMRIEGGPVQAGMVALQCPRCGHTAPMALDDLQGPSFRLQGEEGD
jgi:amino acid transporter